MPVDKWIEESVCCQRTDGETETQATHTWSQPSTWLVQPATAHTSTVDTLWRSGTWLVEKTSSSVCPASVLVAWNREVWLIRLDLLICLLYPCGDGGRLASPLPWIRRNNVFRHIWQLVDQQKVYFLTRRKPFPTGHTIEDNSFLVRSLPQGPSAPAHLSNFVRDFEPNTPPLQPGPRPTEVLSYTPCCSARHLDFEFFIGFYYCIFNLARLAKVECVGFHATMATKAF